MRVLPDMYNDYLSEKQNLDDWRRKTIYNIKMKLNTYSNDDIQKQIELTSALSDLEWRYRRSLIDLVVEILAKHDKIFFAHPDYATFEPIENIEER